MALDIIIVADTSKPHWRDKKALHLGGVDPTGWESLFFNEFGVLTVLEYRKEMAGHGPYEDYYSEQIQRIQREFPLISRMKDYYSDAQFEKNEITTLKSEILALRSMVKRSEAIRFLDQLQSAVEAAEEKGSSILLVAD